VKKASQRVKEKFLVKIKTLGEQIHRQEPKKNSRRRISSPRVNGPALGEEIFKKTPFHLQFFLSSTCTYTKDMFKFDAILSQFAIFKNITSF
jgi:hypothetical protein